MALSPDGSVSFLRKQLSLTKPIDAREVERLVKQLDADDFDTQQSAIQRIEKLGGSAVPHLRQAMEAKPSLEVRKRVEAILARHEKSDEWQRPRQALAVLEYGGSDAAQKWIDELARGAPGTPLTEEARAVKARR
jgi:hypothetical protein